MDAMTNHDKDVLARLKVEMRALTRGAVVSRPITEFALYDRVIDWGGQLLRTQIKSVSCSAPRSSAAANRSRSASWPPLNNQKKCLMTSDYLW